MREQILALLGQYGAPVLFGVTTVASIGVPLPVTVLLIVAGSLVAQGVMRLDAAIVMASAGAIVGDHIGYAIGRWGGTALISRFGSALIGKERIAQAESRARRWGGTGVFLSRWLLTPLGSVINFGSGIAEYPWIRFLIWDIAGEVLGAALYILLGSTFSDRVMALSDVLSNLTWAAVVLAAAVWLGWKLWRAMRPAKAPN